MSRDRGWRAGCHATGVTAGVVVLWALVGHLILGLQQVLNSQWSLSTPHMENDNSLTIYPIIYPTRLHPNLPVRGMIKLGNSLTKCFEASKIIGRIKDPSNHRSCCIWFV